MVELLFVSSNATKILDGGWFPLACGLVLLKRNTDHGVGGGRCGAHTRAAAGWVRRPGWTKGPRLEY